jgi:polyisoprenoid-binding protein YceI
VVDDDAGSGFLDQITVKATTTIKRSEFGIHSMLPAVSDNVNLFMSIDAVKKAAVVSMH